MFSVTTFCKESMESPVDTFETMSEQLMSPDEETRRLAVVGLAGYPLESVKDCLFTAMGDPCWRVRKEAVDAILAGTVGGEVMEALVAMLGAHENAGLRNSAVEALERLGDRAVPSLCRHAGDDDHDVRKFVIDILGSIGDTDAIPLLINALTDPDPNVSAAAAENLGKIGDPRAASPLLSALEKTDIWLRYTILEALGRIGIPVPIEVIRPLAGENLLKKAVFDCLGSIGDLEAVPLLIEGLKEKVRNSRDAAVLALMKVRDRLSAEHAAQAVDARLKELAGTPFLDGLIASMDTPDRDMRTALIKILGMIGDERSTGRLLICCRDDRLRRHCLLAYENMGEAGTRSLLAAFPGADDEERCFIAYVCGELGYDGTGPLLREGMSADSSMLRRVSAIAAGKTGLVALLDDLTRLLDDTEAEVREGAIEALCRLAQRDGDSVLLIAVELAGANAAEKRRFSAILFSSLNDAEKLSLLIKDEDPLVRKTAVNSLAELKSPAAVSHLVMALADEDADVRIAAAGALGAIGGDDVIDPLLFALNDEAPWVKCAVLKSLARLKSVRSVPAIVEVFERGSGLVVIAALEAVAEIGGENVQSTVRKGLENSDEEVIKAAIEILSRNGEDWLNEYGDKLLYHPHWDVRRTFIKAMVTLRGEKALPQLRSVLETESDTLVKETITEIMDRFQ
jgi:HEAT repeat protein